MKLSTWSICPPILPSTIILAAAFSALTGSTPNILPSSSKLMFRYSRLALCRLCSITACSTFSPPWWLWSIPEKLATSAGPRILSMYTLCSIGYTPPSSLTHLSSL